MKNYKLKDEHGLPECGIITATMVENKENIFVFIINLWAINRTTDFSKLKKFEYASIDEMMDAGWVGD